jgi:hypothetical protein
MSTILAVIHGNASIPNEQNVLFTRLESLTGGLTVNAQPDFYDGSRLQDVNKRIREDLAPFIIPTGHPRAPIAPNFFMEVKAPSGAADVVKRQACYNGALGARAMHELQSYREDAPIYDSNAYTITSTYHDGVLKMYTTHPTQSVAGSLEYHMVQIKAWALTGDPDTFRQGAAAFRNARDWAQEIRDGFISATNERAPDIGHKPSTLQSIYPDDEMEETQMDDVY